MSPFQTHRFVECIQNQIYVGNDVRIGLHGAISWLLLKSIY